MRNLMRALLRDILAKASPAVSRDHLRTASGGANKPFTKGDESL